MQAAISRRRRAGRFVVHYLEMCAPMCVGFVVLDLVYFWIAGGFGYTDPFRELPELSVLVVGFNMTAPMALWMQFRGMPRRATAAMSAAMVVWAVVLLVLGVAGVLPKSELALLEHGLMMPVMLVPMLLRIELSTGHMGHVTRAVRVTP